LFSWHGYKPYFAFALKIDLILAQALFKVGHWAQEAEGQRNFPQSPILNYLKTLVPNYALDKLKIEIAGNSDPAFPHLSFGTDWAISSGDFLPTRQFM
jgi:hypothetical protein